MGAGAKLAVTVAVIVQVLGTPRRRRMPQIMNPAAPANLETPACAWTLPHATGDQRRRQQQVPQRQPRLSVLGGSHPAPEASPRSSRQHTANLVPPPT
jgi:hypothetical protein